MSERTVSERVLESVLEERAGEGAPADLRAAILAAVREEEQRRGRGTTGRRRLDGRTLRLLAVAAVLATAGGALVVGGSHPTRPPQPAPTQAVAEAPAESPAATAGLNDCFMMTSLASQLSVDPGFPPDTAASIVPTPANGDVMTAINTEGGYGLVRVDPLQGTSTLMAAGLYSPPSRIVPSPDEALLAVEVASFYANDCLAPFLTTLQGDRYWQPLKVGAHETVTTPVWSADGSTLFAVHAGYTNATDGDPGSILAWDRASGSIARLGSPCDGCRIGSLSPSPDGARLAVVYVGPTCALAGDTSADPDDWWSGCPDSGVAVLDEFGGWVRFSARTLLAGARDGSTLYGFFGWADARTLAFEQGGATDRPGIATFPIDGTDKTTFLAGPCCDGLNVLRLSPDGTKVAVTVVGRDGRNPVLALIDVRDGSSQEIGPMTEYQALDAAWAPDGQSIAVLARPVEPGAGQLVIFPLNGSTRRVLSLPSSLVASGAPISSVAWTRAVP